MQTESAHLYKDRYREGRCRRDLSWGSLVRLGALALLAAAGLHAPAFAQNFKPAPQPQAEPPSVETYVKQLGSSDYDERIEAMEELRELGEKARPLLEKAAKGNDPQVVHSAMTLLKRINRATVEVKLLRPDGTTVPETNITMQLVEKNGTQVNAQRRRQENLLTGKDGLASFGNIDPASYYLTFRAQVGGFLPLYDTRRDFKLKVGLNRIELKLRTGSKVSGRMLDEEGKPLADCKVVLARNYLRRYTKKQADQFARMIANMPSKQSDAAGLFAFDTVPDSKYFIVALSGKKVIFKGDDFNVAEDKPVTLDDLKAKVKAADFAKDKKDGK